MGDQRIERTQKAKELSGNNKYQGDHNYLVPFSYQESGNIMETRTIEGIMV
jgi:hypothetical protein